MKAFKNLIPLNHKITIYVPSTKDINTPIDNTKEVEATAKLLSNCFGGATSTEAVGYWVSDTMGLVKEHPTLVYAYATEENFKKYIDLILDYCYQLLKDMSQDAISLEIDNQLYLIDKNNI